MIVHSTHGLFLTYAQESHLYLHNVQLINIYTMYMQFYWTFCKKVREPQLIVGPISCSWWRIPIHSSPLSGSNCPSLWLLPLSPLSPLSHPSAHITLFTMTTSTIMVFFVLDRLNVLFLGSNSGLLDSSVTSEICQCWHDTPGALSAIPFYT